jgi:hypothetical protein
LLLILYKNEPFLFFFHRYWYTWFECRYSSFWKNNFLNTLNFKIYKCVSRVGMKTDQAVSCHWRLFT